MKHLRRDLIDSERLKQYVFAHPSLTPDIIEDKACVCTPSLFRSTTALEEWRNTVREYCLRWPNDPDWPRFLDCVIIALEWRKTILVEYHFWKPEHH
jgi:hypothetical protein